MGNNRQHVMVAHSDNATKQLAICVSRLFETVVRGNIRYYPPMLPSEGNIRTEMV
jgi:hypothetical protein